MEGVQAFILSMKGESQNKYIYGKSPKNIRNLSVLSRDYVIIIIVCEK